MLEPVVQALLDFIGRGRGVFAAQRLSPNRHSGDPEVERRSEARDDSDIHDRIITIGHTEKRRAARVACPRGSKTEDRGLERVAQAHLPLPREAAATAQVGEHHERRGLPVGMSTESDAAAGRDHRRAVGNSADGAPTAGRAVRRADFTLGGISDQLQGPKKRSYVGSQ